MRTTSLLAAAAFCVAACLPQAQAQTAITIVNPGFEADVITNGAFVVLMPQGWSTYDPSSIINQGNNSVGVIRPNLGGEYFPAGAPQGVNAALVFLAGGQTAEAGLQQTLAATLQANTRYTFSAAIGNIASGTSLAGSTGGAGIFYNLEGFPGYRLDLLAGGVVIGSDNNSIGPTLGEGLFANTSFSVTIGSTHAQLGQSLGIRLVNLKAPGTGASPNIEVDFDNVSLTATAIPEPAAAAAVVGLVAAGLAGWRRRARG